MGQIERFFGIFLLVVVLFAGAYAAISGGLFTSMFQGSGSGGPSTSTVSAIKINGDTDLSALPKREALCACFDDASRLALRVQTTSPDYSTGFQRCRSALGFEGGAAWTAGWESKSSPSARAGGCKAYLKTMNG